MHTVLWALCLTFLTSCAGYHWGGAKPSHLTGIKRIQVPLAKSKVIFPRSEALTTNSVVDVLTLDGTYQIATSGQSDAILYLTLEELSYKQSRSSRVDVLRSEELRLEAKVSFKLIDSRDPIKILEEGKAIGRTRLFVDENLQTARGNALHDALQRAAIFVVSQISDGL